MDRRKKRTSTNQYNMYIEMMEKDPIFASGKIPRDVDGNYLHKKWKELADRLNTCSGGPRLTAEEWRKRLNDWKNTTRCKYRRTVSGEKDVQLTALELKALDLFGKVPINCPDTSAVQLKLEKDDPEEELDRQRTSESFQKELQAAVEEAICDDDEDDGMVDEHDEQEDILNDPLSGNAQTTVVSNAAVGTNSGATTTTYRTIVVENTPYVSEDNNNDHVEFITQRRHTLGPVSANAAGTVATGVQTLVTSAPTTTVTKLINGELPTKRLRGSDQLVYEVNTVKKASLPQQRITIHSNNIPSNTVQITAQPQQAENISSNSALLNAVGLNGMTSQDAQEIACQLKRLGDIKLEKLHFEIAKFKFNNPGFHYHPPAL